MTESRNLTDLRIQGMDRMEALSTNKKANKEKEK